MTDLMTLKARIPAPLADVHRALTDPAAMTVWLAEHAEVSLPDRYAFWGRYTPEGDEPRQRLLAADDRSLRFAWPLDGVETTVEITLDPDGADATVLTLAQSPWNQDDVFSGLTIRGALQTFWSVAIANLADHLDGRELTPKVDFASTQSQFQAEVLVDAPAATIFEALTDSRKVSEWFGFPVEVGTEAGADMVMAGYKAGMVVEIVPGRSMTADWGPTGVSTWELEESGGKTRLTFVQSGFDTGNPPYAAWGGWLAGIAALRRYVELPDRWSIWLEA